MIETKEAIANWGWDAYDQILYELDGAEILFAEYRYEFYEGNALVVWLKDGKLYEAHGSHCSCYGLEGQWSAEETCIEALELRSYMTQEGLQRIREAVNG
jgi:hypothetical protein